MTPGQRSPELSTEEDQSAASTGRRQGSENLKAAVVDADEVEVTERDTAGASSRRPGPGVWRIVLDLLLGRPPDSPRPRYPRALRTSWRRAVVTAEAVEWRNRAGRRRRIERSRISRVELVQTVPFLDRGGRGTDIAVDHHLVVGTAGGVLLRIRDTSTDGDTAMRARWSPLDVPTARTNLPINRLKDARRRWPEAFSIVTAHPVISTALVTCTFMYALPRVM